MYKKHVTLSALLSFLVVVAMPVSPSGHSIQHDASGMTPATRTALLKAAADGAEFLHRQQKPDGSWEFHPGITGLAAAALLRRPGVDHATELKTTGRALDSLTKLARPDGGIHADDLETYVTAIAVMALQAGGRAEDIQTIRRGRGYLVEQLLDDGEGLTPDDEFYGGIGYAPPPTKDAARGDIINLEFGLRALKETDLQPDDPSWDKALQFLERLQNRSASNDQEWAADDGGFIYQPGLSKVEGDNTTSYGSATYAGVLSFTYANLKKGDPRVDSALDWIRAKYTVDENPGLGQKTVYYYYMVLAKALAAVGDPVIVDTSGQSHYWREDLAKKLIELQHDEGFWVNPVKDEWQDNPVLVTSFTLAAIEAILR